MHILHVVGARPNFMKLAPVHRALARRGAVQAVLHTGQHYDRELDAAIWRDVELPIPDVNLGVGSGTQAEQTARMLVGIEEHFLTRRPRLVIVYGDVNSTLAATLAAVKLGIPVAHVEAGLRSGNRAMPEEINRLVTDRLSTWLFTPSQDADDNLRCEGLPPSAIRLVGNVMIDTLLMLLPRADSSAALRRLHLDSGGTPRFALVTLHRPSNVDDPDMLRRLIETLDEIAADIDVIFPVHPRTRARMAEFDIAPTRTRITESLSYLEFLGLQRHARFVITDSGGVQEETTFLGVPCLTFRNETERPVTVSLGTNTLIGCDVTRLKQEAAVVLAGRYKTGTIPPLWDGSAAERIAQQLLS